MNDIQIHDCNVVPYLLIIFCLELQDYTINYVILLGHQLILLEAELIIYNEAN